MTTIQNHFAVMCIMEDLIGSPDAESESAMLESRARAVGQLSSLASTMGRDWCENEIVPYLARVALEDEKCVSLRGCEQVAALCETKYFINSPPMQDSLLLGVGVGLLTSTHAAVRDRAVDAVRSACVICAGQRSASSSSSSPSSACMILLGIVHRLFVETAFPASIASGLMLLAPFLSNSSSFSSSLNPLCDPESRNEAMSLLNELLAPGGVVERTRFETALCGGTGRASLIDTSLVMLLKELLSFQHSSQLEQQRGGSNSSASPSLLEAIHLLLTYLNAVIFSSPVPSAMLLESILPPLCELAHKMPSGQQQHNENSSSSNSSNRALVERMFVRCIIDWSGCDDWAVRFEIAKHGPQLFQAVLPLSRSLALELLQTTLPRLVRDDEVEVNMAAATCLPRVMALADENNLFDSSSSSSSSSSSYAGVLQQHQQQQLAASSTPQVQEAFALALGEAVAQQKQHASSSSNNNNNSNSNAVSADTAHDTLSQLLQNCQDDIVRAQIVESFLWSSVMPQKVSNSNSTATSRNNLISAEVKHSLTSALEKIFDNQTPNWRVRDHFAECSGKMVAHLLLSFSNSNQKNHTDEDPMQLIMKTQGCLEYIVQPFVRLLFDRFYQVRSSALGQIVEAINDNNDDKNSNNNNYNYNYNGVNHRLQQQRLNVLWQWVQHEVGGDGMRAPHYQSRIAYCAAAIVCAPEADALRALEAGAADAVPNVRRAAAQALGQGCSSSSASSPELGNDEQQAAGAGGGASAVASSSGAAGNNAQAKQLLGISRPSELVPGFCFEWSSSEKQRVLALLSRLAGDEAAVVRESAGEGLARCS